MVVWGCRFIFNITMFFMMIMTGQPTLTHPPRRPHWWKTNDDLLRVVFLYFGVVLSQWILSSGWTDHDGMLSGIWIDESKGLSTFRNSHGSKRIHIWANRWWFQFFVFFPFWIGDMTQSDEKHVCKGVETTNLWFTNFQSKFDSSSSQKLEGYFLHQGINDLDKVTNDYIIHIMFV